MATTTPNYGWTVPTSTDLVKDGATAIETLGDAVDATVFANANAAIAKTIVDAKGDIIAATAADTVARLPVGTNGQALKANSATATGLEWGSVAATKTYSLLGTGTLTSGSTVTVSGISNMDSIYVIVNRASVTTTSTVIQMRINADTGSNYKQGYASFYNDTTFHPAWLGSYYLSNTYLTLGQVGDNAGQEYSGAIQISGGATAGSKMYMYQGAVNNNATQARNYGYIGGGWWDNAATISSISLVCSSGTFDAGSFFVYGSA